MNVSILLALGAMMAGALSDIIYRVVQRKGIDPPTFVFYQSATFSFTVWTVAIATGQVSDILPSTWLFGLPIGLLSYVGILLFVTSMREGSASVNAPIFRLSFVITSVAAIFILHEPLNLPKLIGILLAVAGVLSLADLAALKSGRGASPRSMLLLLAATLAFGIAGVLNKEATNQGSTTIPLVIVSTITFNGSSLLRMLLSRRLRPNTVTMRIAPFVGLLQLAWTVLLIESLQTGDASISFPIVQLSFVLTAILAVVFLRERVTKGLVTGLSASTLAVLSFAFA